MKKTYKYTHEDLDKRICDIHPEASNVDTLRKFIRESEEHFELRKENLDFLPTSKLNAYIESLDYLWTK